MPVDANMRERVASVLAQAVEQARGLEEGQPASYIPELANAPLQATSAAIILPDGESILAGDANTHRFTLQSSAKLILLAGLLEERGEDEVFRVVGKEPSGGAFASIARLETHGPLPANPLVNAGAIALAGLLGGNLEDRLAWLEHWAQRLCGEPLGINPRVLASERRTGHRNRAIAYLLRSTGTLQTNVDEVLECYFTLCSFEAGVAQAARLAGVLARGGLEPGGTPVLTRRTVSCMVSLMATCGMYDESGSYLLDTGLPAKSGVSGIIVAVAPRRAGIAVASPRVNAKGGSVRGHAMLRRISRDLGWHFALPG